MQDNIFEEIKHINEYENEYWKAREFAKVIGYKDFSNFLNVIKKSKISCKNSKNEIKNHFSEVTEMVKIGSETERGFDSFELSRYACYLIIQNADPRKEMVALGQTYFAIQTRKQEITENLIEDERRVQLREEVKKHNVQLAEAAKSAGVKEPIDYANFQNFGYMGLYNGLDNKGIHKKKGLKKSQKILDHMGSEELAANLFRATQAEAKLKRENIFGKDNANNAHMEVGKEVRETIKKLGSTMPEELSSSDSVKKAERRVLKNNKIVKIDDKIN